jgi:predicted nucleotidyltransferase
MKRLGHIKLRDKERTAIIAFSRRLKKTLGKQLVSVLLFGSKARGDADKGSDIDVFILIKNKKNKVDDRIAEVTASVLNDYDVLISPVSYDLHEQQVNVRMHSFFFEAVEKEGIPI